jgi:hypothetical protein
MRNQLPSVLQSEILPDLWPQVTQVAPGELWLLIAPFRLLEIERVVIPWLAMRGPVHIIVGGHTYDADGILRSLRKLTADAARIRRRIFQRRAPTAFQLRALLQKTEATPEPVVVLNFLINYLDDEEDLWKAEFLLERSIDELHRLSVRAPVLVTARPPRTDQPNQIQLFNQLRSMTDRVIELMPPAPPQQLSFANSI